jgi:hypothetical protein
MFQECPEHTAAFVPSWHKFKYSISVEIGLLLSQPFTISDFHFFIVVLPTAASAAEPALQLVLFEELFIMMTGLRNSVRMQFWDGTCK